MSKQTMEVALKSFDERYYKYRIEKTELDKFGDSLSKYIDEINKAINESESEEHIKKIVNKFLEKTFYSDENYDINTYKRADSSIKHRGVLHAIIEAKKPKNKLEMVRVDDINRKALWEIVFYYLSETRLTDGEKVKYNSASEIRRLIISDSQEWYIINAQDLDKLCNGYLEQKFFEYKNDLLPFKNDNDKFYSLIGERFSNIDVTEKLLFVHFNIVDVYNHRGQWQYLYKLLLPAYLLKDGYKQLSKTHVLNSKFYKELLYVMGLREEEVNKKKLIVYDKTIKNSLIGQIIPILQNNKGYNKDTAVEHAFQLSIIWINRLLFIKLFEGQLLSFNGDSPCYHILDNDKISSFHDMNVLFFDVFGCKQREDDSFINQFSQIPYLNSSLFERYKIEQEDINIDVIRDLNLPLKQGSVLGKKNKSLPLLKYLIDFLNSYSFSAQLDVDGTIKKKVEIIDASVLGLIFEKINGYKDGSYYTKGFVTEYICKETIERTIIDKINSEFGWTANTIDELKFQIDLKSREQIVRINEIINSIKICDPAVGSGHFLVSAMNRIIAVKKELGILMKADNRGLLTEYDIDVIDDILCVFDGQGNEYKYSKNDALSQIIQKTLFNEKRTIIENCLFGVDINSNAVAICQLRLWIELLKNAYYENGIMETLPNIDINIKCGNSLVHKIKFETGKKISTNNADLRRTTIQKYKNAVRQYKESSDKNNKSILKRLIEQIHESLDHEYDQMQMVSDNGEAVLAWQSETDEMFDFYHNAFEWAIGFPEILDEDGVFKGFDCIIGNPPYISVREMNHREIDYYKKTYTTAFERLDISTLFIELAAGLISENGRISYITSNQFITAEYGKKIRGFISDYRLVYKTVDFGSLPVFDGALTYVSVFFMSKSSLNNDSLLVFKVPELPFIVPEDNAFFQVNYSDLSEEPWELEDQATKQCLNNIRSATTCLLQDYAHAWAGVVSGNDDILMCDYNSNLPIEPEMQLSLVRADSCTRYGKANPSRKIFYPYREDDEGETQLIPLDELQHNYPLTYNYIVQNENELRSRRDSRRAMGERQGWYGLVRFGKISTFRKTKIVSPGEVKHNKFCLDESESAYSHPRVVSVTVDNEEMNINYLLAILNSSTMEFYLHKTAAVKDGGYYAYSPTVLNLLPIVLSEERKQEIISLTNQIMELKNQGNDTSDLEESLDVIIYQIYGLEDTDVEIIKKEIEKA